MEYLLRFGVFRHFSVNYMWPCIHRPTFEDQYKELCKQMRLNTKQFTTDQLSTLALYATCLAVGFHFLQDEGYQDLNMNEQQALEMGATCWRVSYQALEAADWMQVNDVRSCQTVIISGLYLSGVRRANQHWNLLGIATKIAMALGLAQIPDEGKIIASGSAEKVAPRWRSAIQREVGRRVWYCLLELDWLFAMEHDYLYIISPEINQTSEPANIEDVDLKDDGLVFSRPTATHTGMTHFLQRLRILYPLQGVVTNVKRAGRMHYRFITRAHEELQRAIAERPLFYKQTDGLDSITDAVQLNQIKREAQGLNEATDLRTMRIHRFYFPASCENNWYSLTKDTCLDITRRTLKDLSTQTAPTVTNPHLWARIYFIFTATVVVIIYLYHAPPYEVDEFTKLAEIGIAWLASTGKRSIELGDSSETLRALLSIQLDRRVRAREEGGQMGQLFPQEWINNAGWADFMPLDFDGLRDSNVPDVNVPVGPAVTDEQNMAFLLDSLFKDLSNYDPSFPST
ncbi:uncharacterized protein I303_106927 [Kwoniella dejecticola CBS 10117]|uniref:Xylanolytic transcriptional activator regulatory domain-containing protein n=1 Tax=Kwoniella dejecticola CBS 10117 TaxID=1296121 RepID=A0A1A5ZTA9_9TREE|nr:uncharacterized protein I303_08434 [Kwoniella dejecticola CBS 10117]OBR81052.1 hypothetical protein I303_08434 [Kwoniella dejecticola CBS 10117]